MIMKNPQKMVCMNESWCSFVVQACLVSMSRLGDRPSCSEKVGDCLWLEAVRGVYSYCLYCGCLGSSKYPTEANNDEDYID